MFSVTCCETTSVVLNWLVVTKKWLWAVGKKKRKKKSYMQIIKSQELGMSKVTVGTKIKTKYCTVN